MRKNKPVPLAQAIEQLPGVRISCHNTLSVADKWDYPLKAAWPMLTNQAKAVCFSRYKHYEKEYNEKAMAANKQKTELDFAISEHLQNSPKKHLLLSIQSSFEKNYRHLNVWQYNEKAEKTNAMHGVKVIAFKKAQLLRDNHENFFRLLLWEYSAQLKKYSDTRKATGSVYMRSVPQIEINTKHLENSKGVNGLYLTHIVPETMLNRKNRLEEAGILQNSVFRGRKRGTLHHINPEILAVFDCLSEKITSTENQSFIIDETKKIRDTDISTRTLSEHSIKGDVKKTSPEKGNGENASVNSLPLEDCTRTPSSRTKAVPQTESKPGPEISGQLRDQIMVIWAFVRNLTNFTYINKPPLCRKTLYWEAHNGSMGRSDFRELLIQEFFKLASRLYQGKTIFEGEWTKAYYQFSNFVMLTKKGEVFHKTKSLEVFMAMEFALTDPKFGALKASGYSKFQFAPPTWYLDPTNDLKGSFKFFYKSVLERHQKNLQKQGEITNNQRINKEKRLQDYENNRKLERKLRQHELGKISLEELIRYVQYNMPPHFRASLTERIAKFASGFSAA